jgi:hypothetical protein
MESRATLRENYRQQTPIETEIWHPVRSNEGLSTLLTPGPGIRLRSTLAFGTGDSTVYCALSAFLDLMLLGFLVDVVH